MQESYVVSHDVISAMSRAFTNGDVEAFTRARQAALSTTVLSQAKHPMAVRGFLGGNRPENPMFQQWYDFGKELREAVERRRDDKGWVNLPR